MLDSPAYRARLAKPTEWSKKTMARFKNMIRAVMRITISRGQGRGAALGIVRLRPSAGSENTLRAALREKLDPAKLDGVISMHLLESDPVLSGPTTEIPSTASPGAGDWFVLIDGTDVSAISALLATRFTASTDPAQAAQVSSGVYELMWDLAKSDIALT